MKRMIATGLMLLAGTTAQAEERKALIEVSGMYCASCPYIAAQAMTSVESVQITDGYFDPKAEIVKFLIVYDDEITTAEAVAAIPTEYGYPAVILSAEELAEFEKAS